MAPFQRMSFGSSSVVIKVMGSFKFNLQLCNTEHPNSQKSTTLVSVFKAGDSTTNLHTALDMYKEQLQGMTLEYVYQ